MFSNRVIISLILLLIIIIGIIIMCVYKYKGVEGFAKTGPSTWNRNKCPYLVGKTYEDVFKDFNIKKDETNWDVYLPCNYDDPNKEISEMPVLAGKKYFIVGGGDSIVAKDFLWKYVVDYYGISRAREMLPYSYLLGDAEDLDRFDKEYEFSKLYIMKKNIQRQEGLKITKSREDVLEGGIKHGYVIAQELLQDPYTINGRKTNMRFYVLVLCTDGKTNVYVYKNGFMYYTTEKFIKGSTETGPNITSGFVSRDVYVDNPLTHDDLRKYLDDPNRKNLLPAEKEIKNNGSKISQVYFQRIYKLIRDIFVAFTGKLCIQNKLSENITFQLFGVDIAVDDKLNVKMMEVNKGPSLDSKDQRDGELKYNVVKDVFKLVGVIDTNEKNDFIKII